MHHGDRYPSKAKRRQSRKHTKPSSPSAGLISYRQECRARSNKKQRGIKSSFKPFMHVSEGALNAL
eukprot:966378-Pleurochrysis_carterae.AAC.1